MRTVIIAILLAAGAAGAVELEAGRSYQGPVRIDVSDIDASFQLTSGWTGAVQGEFFVAGHKSTAGIVAATARPKVSVAELRSFLSEPIPLDDQGTVLIPEGAVKATGDRLVARFGGEGVAGYAVVRRHKSGRAIAFIGATTPDKLAKLKPTVEKLAGSVRFKKAAPQSAFWRKQIVGQKLHLYNTGSSTTSHRRISICPDGTYTYRSSSSGASTSLDTSVSFAGQGGSSGRWKVSGTQKRGKLVLTDETGASTYELRFNPAGHFLVDGERWLRDANELECN